MVGAGGLEAVVEAGADVNEITLGTGLTALMRAVMNGRDGSVKTLVAAGAELEARDVAGRTALLHAVTGGRDGCVMALVRAGADVNTPDDEGCTPLMHATLNPELSKQLLYLRELLYAGADVNIIHYQGGNALEHYLLSQQVYINEKIVMILFAAGEKLTWTSEKCHQYIISGQYLGHVDVPQYIHQIMTSEDGNLMSRCRAVIRRHLLKMGSENLFARVPCLKLPSLLTEFLLYDVSLDLEHD